VKCSKAREIDRRSLSNIEEEGLRYDTLLIAVGVASWPVNGGGTATEAAVILAPAILKRQGREGSQVEMALAKEPQMNPVLLSEAGIRLRAASIWRRIIAIGLRQRSTNALLT
jgi:hypothetical protein